MMTSAVAHAQSHQRELMRVLLDAGATPARETIVSAAAHGMLDALRFLVERGHAVDTRLAATFGDAKRLATLLNDSTKAEIDEAFGLAVINRRLEAARVALDSGANIDACKPVHAHGTALHQAAAANDAAMIALLRGRGARDDIRDTLWEGTPLDWARFINNAAAIEALEKIPERDA